MAVPGKPSPTQPTRVRAAQRREQAFHLRLAGATYSAIGAALGISKQAAHSLVLETLDETRIKTAEAVAQVRELEVARIDAIVAKLWAQRGDPRTADTILRAIDRRARLLGLDAPTKVEADVVSNLGPMTDDERAARIDAIFERARARRAAAAARGQLGVAAEPGAAGPGLPLPS